MKSGREKLSRPQAMQMEATQVRASKETAIAPPQDATAARRAAGVEASGALPLVIGVTGHRDLRAKDEAPLKARVGELFADWRKRYPHTPLTLLSPLAEGADRLVARAALDAGAQLIVPLPMRRELYEMDFSSTESRAEFSELLAEAEHYFALPLVRAASEEAIREHGAARNDQYAAAGAYVVRHCQILIALWDGASEPSLMGGTSQIVNFKLEGVPYPFGPRRKPLAPQDCGPVYHIVTARRDRPEPKESLTLRKLYPKHFTSDASAQKQYEDTYKRIEAYNRDALWLKSKSAGRSSDAPQENRSGSDLLLGAERGRERLAPTLLLLQERYAVCDALALHYRRMTWRMLRVMLALAFVGTLLLKLSGTFAATSPWLDVSYMLTLLLAYVCYYWSQRADYQNKYQDYRALAEGLRVLFFWQLGGLADDVSEQYLRMQESELDWIRHAIRTWSAPLLWPVKAAQSGADAAIAHSNLPLVLPCWVEDQDAYFTRAIQRDRRKLKIFKRASSFFFGVGVVWMLLTSAAEYGLFNLASLLNNRISPGWALALATLFSLMPVIGALVYSYSRFTALSEQTKHYEAMRRLFERARQQLTETPTHAVDSALAQLILRELGSEALAENAAWVILHRQRPLERPAAK